MTLKRRANIRESLPAHFTDRGEDVVAGMRREVREEAGLECETVTLRGTISWPGFGKQGEDWFGFIFRVDRWTGVP